MLLQQIGNISKMTDDIYPNKIVGLKVAYFRCPYCKKEKLIEQFETELKTVECEYCGTKYMAKKPYDWNM